MHASSLSQYLESVRRHTGTERSTEEHPVIRERRVTATALTLWAVALGVLIGIRWGLAGLACYLPWLPFAFIIVWVSTTALRFDERELPESHAPERAREAIDELHRAEARSPA